MKAIWIFLLLALAVPSLAHPGEGDHHHHHDHVLNQKEAETKAESVVVAKAEQGKISKHWAKLEAAKSYKKTFGHGPEWVVEFHDPKASSEKEKVLYVFLSLKGKVLGTNFTGH